MANVRVSKNSLLRLAELLTVEDVLFWDQKDLPEIPETLEDQYIQVDQLQAKRVDLIAHDFYGDPTLLWAILLANNLDAPNQILEGQVLRIPPISVIDALKA